MRIILLALIFGIYASFATHSYYWDGISFALAIENFYRKAAPFGVLFHPNHLLYNLAGYWVFRVFRALGLMGRALWVLQGLNILISVCCGYVVFRIAEWSFKSAALAFYCWLLFAFGALWWEFSTDADAYIIAIFFLTLSFFYILTRGVRYLPMVCVLHVLAMVVHELSLFFFVPVLISIWLEPGMRMRRRILCGAGYCVAAALLVGSLYYFCFRLALHPDNGNVFSWALSHADDVRFAYSVRNIILVNALSYIKLFLGGKLSFVYAYLSAPTLISLLAAVSGIAFFAVLLRRRKFDQETVRVVRRSERGQRCLRLAISWVLPYAVFLSVWLPQNGFYKLLIWPPLVLLLGCYLSLRPRLVSAAAALLVAQAGWNFAAYVYPRSHDSAAPVVQFAKELSEQLPRGTVIYYASFVPDDWYLQYFTPGTEWRHLDSPDPGLLTRAISEVHPRVCVETTALAQLRTHALESGTPPPVFGTQYKWDLVSRKYNVRMRCMN
ncbi:MAG TPA: hypothetical protein VGL97_05865 [Bryobacteraceae bacterium]|jgi:hypothetical protein